METGIQFNDEGTSVATLAAIGSVIGFRGLPVGSAPSEPVVSAVRRALGAIVALDEALGGIDRALPIMKRRELAQAPFVLASLRLDEARTTVDREDVKLSNAKAKLEVPPPADGVAGAMLDSELRAVFAAGDQSALLGAMVEGAAPELLAALARFPLPAPAFAQARTVYREQQRAAHPQRVADIDAMQERVSWGRGIIREIDGAIAKVSNEVGLMPVL